MSEIWLLRHAKSLHPGGTPDRERPLSPRGERSADLVGAALASFGASPDVVITSPARRARDTAQRVIDGASWDVAIQVVDSLYGGGVATLLAELARHSGHGTVLAVGHEPTWSAAVADLIGGGTIQMVTAALACVETPLPPVTGSGRLRWMIHPRLLDRSTT